MAHNFIRSPSVIVIFQFSRQFFFFSFQQCNGLRGKEIARPLQCGIINGAFHFVVPGRVRVNDALIVTHNVPATNGVIHAIDGVLWWLKNNLNRFFVTAIRCYNLSHFSKLPKKETQFFHCQTLEEKCHKWTSNQREYIWYFFFFARMRLKGQGD